MLKGISNKYFQFFFYFYEFVRYRMFVILCFSILVGFLDGLGLAMFLPLLEMADSQAGFSEEKLGELKFIIEAFEQVGIPINLKSVLLLIFIFFTLKGIAKFIEGYYKLLVTQYFIRKMRNEGISLLGGYRFESFITSNSGRIQNTLSGQIGVVSGAFSHYLALMQAMVMLTVYVVLAYLANAQFALFITIGAMISNLIFRFIYKRTKELSRKLTRIQHGYQNLLIQMVSNFKYLKATGFMKHMVKMIIEENEQILKNGKKTGFYNVIVTTIREPIIIGIVVVAIMVQVVYMEQQLSLIILSLLFFYRALTFVLNFQATWNKVLLAAGPVENMKAFFKELSDEQTSTGLGDFEKLESGVNCRNINFSYGDTRILTGIDIEFKKDETIALVGESGSGKTTLVNLLTGLLKPLSGEITVNGTELSNINLESYQRRIGYITQEPVIFNDTIYNNVTFWQPKTQENVSRFKNAMTQASIWQYTQGLEGQEDALLGNNGINLSGGQKQRISIARELYKDIDILIMDEATSALDSETELSIQKSIDDLQGQYTIFMVAHRLSTIKKVDRVILMDKGEIETSGTYAELLRNSDKFRHMVSLQELITQ